MTTERGALPITPDPSWVHILAYMRLGESKSRHARHRPSLGNLGAPLVARTFRVASGRREGRGQGGRAEPGLQRSEADSLQ